MPQARALKSEEFRALPGLAPILDKNSPNFSPIHRLLVCYHGLDGTAQEISNPKSFLNHLWRLSYLRSGANADSPMVRTISCPASLRKSVVRWLGISHALSFSAKDRTDFKKINENIKLIYDPKYSDFGIYAIQGSGPNLALYSPKFQVNRFIDDIQKGHPI